MLLFVFAMLFARQGQAQNSPACDSVSITNFRFDTMPGQLALEAANISSNGFGYPGFIFFDSNMDTLAKETVDYFGIWNSPQTHKLVIKNQINSPQTGFLSLYGGFYDTLYCTWPVTLQDTPLAATESLYGEIEMSPNPSSGQVKLRWTQQGINTPASATVFNLRGQIVAELPRIGLNPVFSVEDWTPGLYLVQIRTADQQQICLKKLLVR
jgi:hypothetical protein